MNKIFMKKVIFLLGLCFSWGHSRSECSFGAR